MSRFGRALRALTPRPAAAAQRRQAVVLDPASHAGANGAEASFLPIFGGLHGA
jgi:hypothetical protein